MFFLQTLQLTLCSCITTIQYQPIEKNQLFLYGQDDEQRTVTEIEIDRYYGLCLYYEKKQKQKHEISSVTDSV